MITISIIRDSFHLFAIKYTRLIQYNKNIYAMYIHPVLIHPYSMAWRASTNILSIIHKYIPLIIYNYQFSHDTTFFPNPHLMAKIYINHIKYYLITSSHHFFPPALYSIIGFEINTLYVIMLKNVSCRNILS